MRTNIWTTEEDGILLDVLRKEIAIGKTYKEAFTIAEPYLPNRNYAGIAGRWNGTLKKQEENQDIVENAEKNMAEAQRKATILRESNQPQKEKNESYGWSPEEDFKVADTILKKTAKGDSLTKICKELSLEMGNRTNVAIEARWRTILKPVFLDEYEESLKKKENLKPRVGKVKTEVTHTQEELPIDIPVTVEEVLMPKLEVVESKKVVTQDDFQQVTDFVKKATTLISENSALKRLNAELQQKFDSSELEKQTLKAKIERLEREAQTMEEDYKSILGLMDKARRLMLAEEESQLGQAQSAAASGTAKFKMDRNGNLERY